MIRKIELLERIAKLECQVMWLEERVDKLEKLKKARKKNETHK